MEFNVISKRYCFIKSIVFYCPKCKKIYEYKTVRYELPGLISVKHTISNTVRRSEIISFNAEKKTIILKSEESYIIDDTGILLQPICPKCKTNSEKNIIIAMNDETFQYILKELL